MHIAHDEKKKSAHEAFYEPYELLGMRNDPLIKKGIKEALNIQRVSHCRSQSSACGVCLSFFVLFCFVFVP